MLAAVLIPFVYSISLKLLFSTNKVKKNYYLMLIYLLYTLFAIIYYIINSASLYLVTNFIYKKIVPILFVVIILFLKNEIRFRFFEHYFGVFAFINAVTTIIQYIMDDILWSYTVDNYGNPLFFSVYNYGNFDRIRPPGLMNSALSSGYISVIWICLILYKLLKAGMIKKREKQKYIFYIILAFCSLLTTQTRNIYVTLLFIIAYCVIAKIFKFRTFIMPIFTALASFTYFLLFIYFLPVISTLTGLLNNGSAIIRYTNWAELLNRISRESLDEILFGIMKWQEIAPNEVFSDNLFFDIFFASGLAGLIIYVFTNLRLQTLLMKSKKCIPISALVASILFIGVANVPNSSYESVILIFSAIIVNNFGYTLNTATN